MMHTFALQTVLNSVGVLTGCIIFHKQKNIADRSTENLNMRQQNFSNTVVIVPVSSTCNRVAVTDHDACPYHDATRTISVPFLDIFQEKSTTNFTLYELPSATRRKTESPFICEENIGPAVPCPIVMQSVPLQTVPTVNCSKWDTQNR